MRNGEKWQITSNGRRRMMCGEGQKRNGKWWMGNYKLGLGNGKWQVTNDQWQTWNEMKGCELCLINSQRQMANYQNQ